MRNETIRYLLGEYLINGPQKKFRCPWVFEIKEGQVTKF